MFIISYILDNCIMLYELAGLWIMLLISAHISVRMKRLTRAAVILLFLESLCFRVEAWTQTFDTMNLMRPMLTAFTYSIYPVILLLVMQITRDKDLPKRTLRLALVPLVICVPLYFTSQWTHLVCWFTEENYYRAGPLHLMPYAIFAFYALLFLINNFAYFRHYARMNRIILAYIVIGPIAGVLLTLLVNGQDQFCALFTSAIVLYYLCLYIHMARIDPLTSLLNRQSYYQDIKDNAARITGVVSADMNELKYINDTQGHEAGDTAIRTIAAVLRDGCGRGATVYRVGGDEFMIFYESADEERIRASIAAMERLMAETPYVCAFGCDVKTPDKTLSDMIRISDRRMYEDKAARKKALLEHGGALYGRDGS